MATPYARLNKTQIGQLIGSFMEAPILSFDLLSGGSENTNYLVRTDLEEYVLVICEQKSLEQAAELASFLLYLETQGFQTSRIISTISGESVVTFQGKPVMLRSFLKGRIRKDLSPMLLKTIGSQLGRLHKIEAPEYLPRQLDYGQQAFHKVSEYAAGSAFEKWLQDVLCYLKPYLQQDLPRCLIHSDLFWNNVIITEDRQAMIMDFEEATYYYRIYDLGMAFIGCCSDQESVSRAKITAFMDGYSTEIQLSQQELDALQAFTIYAGASMTFWRHRNFNFVKPDPARYDHYLGLKVLVDGLMNKQEEFSAFF